MTTIPALEFRGISKRFGHTQALANVSFEVQTHAMHMVLGENGAGKSTLMKILVGLYKADAGEIRIHGRPVRHGNPRQARANGIGMVFQSQALIPSLTVEENLLLGDERVGTLLPSAPLLVSGHSEFLDGVDLKCPISQLSRAERQRVEIERLLRRGAEFLILDEPTAVLTPLEAELLFVKLLKLTREGKTVIVITHRLPEVAAYADAVTVLRAGTHVATLPAKSATQSELAKLMVGDLPEVGSRRKSRPRGEIVLSINDLSVGDGMWGKEKITNLSMDVHSGECVGVAGVAGNGQKELVEVIMRERADFSGRICIGGRNIDAIDGTGIAYVPDNARQVAIAPSLSILENVMMKDFGNERFSNRFFVDFEKLSAEAKTRLSLFETSYPSIEASAEILSGGNLQRLVLSREFGLYPSLAIVVNPTAGLDIKATSAVHRFLRTMVDDGCAVLLVSYDLDEILELSDRVIVMGRGHVAPAKDRTHVSLKWLAEEMGGHTARAAPEHAQRPIAAGGGL